MKICILEKPGKSLDQILEWLAEYDYITGIYAFENEIQFLDQIGMLSPELSFINVSWGDLHGLRVAEIVKQASQDSRIIILSDTKDYAMEAFEAGVDGYLMFPLDRAKFMKTVSWIKDRTVEV